jgi:hypothetical protein
VQNAINSYGIGGRTASTPDFEIVHEQEMQQQQTGPVARSGQINYGALDSLGRPTGASAILTPDRLGTGTRASQSITPPGYVTDANFARGHLIGRQLGGSGSEPGNLVTIFQNPAIRPGTVVIEGRASGQGLGLPGGAWQKFILNADNLLNF